MKKKILSLLVLLTLFASAMLFTTSVAYADDATTYTVYFMLDETTEYQRVEVEENKYLLIVNASNTDKDYEWIKSNLKAGAICENLSSDIAQIIEIYTKSTT